MGAPGVGVGTCMRMVAPILLVSSLFCLLLYRFLLSDPSTLFRRKCNRELSLERLQKYCVQTFIIIQKYVFRGELIPDEYIIPKMLSVIRQPQYRSGIIMVLLFLHSLSQDGFPRTIAQAEALEEVWLLNRNHFLQVSPVDIAIAFSMPKDIVVKKLTSRR